MKLPHLLTACAVLLTLAPSPAAAQTSAVPAFISYQGRVVDATGANVGTGTPVNRTVIFRIWDNPSSTNIANLIYSEVQTVTVSEGEFSVLVGQGVANPTSTYGYSETTKKLADIGSAFGGSTRYLGVTVASAATIATTDNEITPRQQIVSTAFSMRAKYAEQVGSNGIAALTALDSGRVGIGTLAPPALFTVSGANVSTSTATPQLLVTADDLTERLRIGVDSTGTGTGFIQAFKEGTGVGTGAQNLLLNPNGGNVGIGNTNPAVALSVTGAITATGAITGGSFTTAAGSLTTNTGNIGIGTTAPIVRLQIDDGTTAGSYGSVQISRPNTGHTGSHLAFVRAGVTAMGLGYAQTSNVFGFGQGTSGAFSPGALSIDANNWYVGIGTAAPANLLQVLAPIAAQTATNTVTSANAVAAIGASDTALHFGTYNNNNGYGNWIQSKRTWDAYSFPLALNPNGGGVGIGISNPTAKLDVNGNVYVRGQINLDSSIIMANGPSIWGTNTAGLAEQCLWPRSANGTYLNYGTAGFYIRNNASTTTMYMTDTGNVGIGTTSPGAPLHVAKKFDVHYTTTAITNANGTFTPQLGNADGYTAHGSIGMNGQFWQTSIFADGAVAGSAFVAMSDLRIKDIVNRSSTQNDLALINQLQVTDYRLKDSIANGMAIRKGFIAQEVRKIIPEAVGPSLNYIPDIYVLATQSVYDAAQKRLSVTLAKPHALAVGESVRIYGDDNTMETKVLTVESATSFTVASEKPVAKAFVYGRRVDDFLTVDYDRLFTTGIGAIQDLARQLETVQDENAALRRELATKDRELAAKDQSVEARLIALERRMSGEDETKTVSIKTAKVVK
jgi:hypothetical protein